MAQTSENVQTIVLAACVLHNHMPTKYAPLTNPLLEDPEIHDVTPWLWRDDDAMTVLALMRENHGKKQAKPQHDYLKAYYNGPVGRVEWQDNMI